MIDRVKGSILRVKWTDFKNDDQTLRPKEQQKLQVDIKTGFETGMSIFVPYDHEMILALEAAPRGAKIEVDGFGEKLDNGRLKPMVLPETVIVVD